MNTFRPRFFLLGPSLLLAVIAGCSSSPQDCPVTGEVTLDGKPLPEAEISFNDQDTKIAPGVAPVTNGAFQFSVKPGKKTVRVYARKLVPGTNPPMYNEALPPRYNSESELTADVTAGGANKFTFALKSP